MDTSDPVWSSGKALGWQTMSVRFPALALLSLSSFAVCGRCLVILPVQLMKR